jgi:ATP-dependent RNA helicase DOB1
MLSNMLGCVSCTRVPTIRVRGVQIIVFALSKRNCEELAAQLASADFSTPDEAALVERIFWSAMDVLSHEDRALPQIGAALPMLKRGVGVHHSGLLPIVKEVIEVLFGEGLVKV